MNKDYWLLFMHETEDGEDTIGFCGLYWSMNDAAERKVYCDRSFPGNTTDLIVGSVMRKE